MSLSQALNQFAQNLGRYPYVDALSVTQVLALRSLRKKVDKEELSQSQQAGFIYLILCTVSGVAAGLQNTG